MSGIVAAERDFLIVAAERDFLLARLRFNHHSLGTGVAADAMVVAAITGTPPTSRPHDDSDLGSCIITRELAPPHLHEAMDVLIAQWTDVLIEESVRVAAIAAGAS